MNQHQESMFARACRIEGMSVSLDASGVQKSSRAWSGPILQEEGFHLPTHQNALRLATSPSQPDSTSLQPTSRDHYYRQTTAAHVLHRQDMDDQHSVDARHMEHVPRTCNDKQRS